MKNLPKISVVVPSYNKAGFIEETLKSIVAQNYPKLELIIQDGGSTDGTLEIIKKYAQKYPNVISWESKKDKGQVDAINKGLKKATGNIVTYINADDVYEKGALKKVGEYFSENPDTLWLVGRGIVIDAEGKEISVWVTKYKNILLKVNRYFLLLIVNYLMQPSVFLSRYAYQKHGPFTGTKVGVMEYDFWLKLGKVQMPAVLDANLSSFRLTKEGLSSVNFSKILSEDYEVAAKYTKDPIILFLHWLHNLGRVATLFSLRL